MLLSGTLPGWEEEGGGLHISYKDENSHGYNWLKEDPKIYKPRGDTPLCSAKIIRN